MASKKRKANEISDKGKDGTQSNEESAVASSSAAAAAKITKERSRLINNLELKLIGEHKLIHVLKQLLAHDSNVALVSNMLPMVLEHCMICHKDFDVNANTGKIDRCGLEHTNDDYGCVHCGPRECGTCHRCGEPDCCSGEFCFNGHVSYSCLIYGIDEEYSEIIRDEYADCPVCKKLLESGEDDDDDDDDDDDGVEEEEEE